jgi:hypothetical protein
VAGYSKRSLVEKLGIKEDMSVAIVSQPTDYEKTLNLSSRAKRGDPVEIASSVVEVLPRNDGYDLIQYFSRSQEDLKEKFPQFKKLLAKDGMLWISWPKGQYCTFVGSDLNENIIRDIGLENGLVDVKVIAVDENWSGLKFVYRLKDR